ncbi:hypothetical protein AXG93_1615s1400 [Marchantia polymorpha subsp. ruderalis]|uniref:Uncharacterized protein n=1 Tax=Marchantia polymorpha subsp. ruderalis TaxID=1480154 RepID=A0A176VX67_MARPO|nr:hypothetical protein AXG93_1615s1400 [Marchantia polymorpha subsp. ruderalis]
MIEAKESKRRWVAMVSMAACRPREAHPSPPRLILDWLKMDELRCPVFSDPDQSRYNLDMPGTDFSAALQHAQELPRLFITSDNAGFNVDHQSRTFPPYQFYQGL